MIIAISQPIIATTPTMKACFGVINGSVPVIVALNRAYMVVAKRVPRLMMIKGTNTLPTTAALNSPELHC